MMQRTKEVKNKEQVFEQEKLRNLSVQSYQHSHGYTFYHVQC